MESVGLFFLSFSILLLVYASTLYPSVTGGDAGELLAEACALGVPHPPGYPLFTMLGHVCVKIAVWVANALDGSSSLKGVPAYGVNVMSAASGAAAGGFVTLTTSTWLDAWSTARARTDNVALVNANPTTGTRSSTITSPSFGCGSNVLGAPARVLGSVAGGLVFGLSSLSWEYSTGAEVVQA